MIGIAIFAVGFGGYAVFFRKATEKQDFVVIKRGDLIQEVSVTGHVRPAEDVDLAFDRSGRVMRIGARVGDRVGAGAILVVLENGDVRAQLAGQEAMLKAELSKLEDLKNGTRAEEIEIQKAKVKSAETLLEDARKNLLDKIQDAYTKTDDAIRNRADQFFTNPRTSNPMINFLTDNQTKTDLESRRVALEGMLVSWGGESTQLSISDNLLDSSAKAVLHLNQVKAFLNLAALTLAKLSPAANLTQTTLDAYRADISTARVNINTALSNLTSADEKLRGADASLVIARQELVLQEAGSTVATITTQAARVEELEAGVRQYQANLAKTVITAPIGGLVSKMEVKVGEIVSPNTAVTSVISDSQFEIEAHVPEADIAKIKIGDEARVTLDAYGNDVQLEAGVVRIDPAETVIDGVSTYKTTLQFSKKDDRIKSGMTANVDIKTAELKNIIAIPQRAITTRDGKKYVRIIDSHDTIEEREVTTGLRGSDGTVEISSGLSEGVKVLLKVEVQ